jgi:hypothetical protein
VDDDQVSSRGCLALAVAGDGPHSLRPSRLACAQHAHRQRLLPQQERSSARDIISSNVDPSCPDAWAGCVAVWTQWGGRAAQQHGDIRLLRPIELDIPGNDTKRF